MEERALTGMASSDSPTPSNTEGEALGSFMEEVCHLGWPEAGAWSQRTLNMEISRTIWFIPMQRKERHYDFHFPDEDTEALGGEELCPGSLEQVAAE